MGRIPELEVDGDWFGVLGDPRVFAAIMAVGYVWQELPATPMRTKVVLDKLNSLYDQLVRLGDSARVGRVRLEPRRERSKEEMRGKEASHTLPPP